MIGKRVEVKTGDEKGSWGIVKLVNGTEIHVAIANGSDVRIYGRSEITIKRGSK